MASRRGARSRWSTARTAGSAASPPRSGSTAPSRTAGGTRRSPAWRRRAFDDYLDAAYARHPKLIAGLAEYDGATWKDYPDFDAFYEGLDTKLDRGEVWWWLRAKARRKVGDQKGREMVGDYLRDQQLQRAILRTLEALEVKPSSVKEFAPFAEKDFPEVPEEQRNAGTSGSGR